MLNAAPQLIAYALKDHPALIERVFPAQKISFEAQRERKAGAAQTLTGLGSYWKGRKPLILVRAVILGMLLPETDNLEKDILVFEKLLAIDEEGLAKRALAANTFSIAELKKLTANSADLDHFFINKKWRVGITDKEKLTLYRLALKNFPDQGYDKLSSLGKRPEEVNATWLYSDIWPVVNHYYQQWGIHAYSFETLVKQLGILRYGHRPWVGDAFCGAGSIPFEAARIGCNTYASDLNPIACMLTWGALNIVGKKAEAVDDFATLQKKVFEIIDQKITKLGIEHDKSGNRAKTYLYCSEIRCPETGWMIPLSPTWVISKKYRVIAKLIPNERLKKFDIAVETGVTETAMQDAEQGTIQKGYIVYALFNKSYRLPIKILRGDFTAINGQSSNKLRRWTKEDFKPQEQDLFQERLYAIQWIKQETIDAPQQKTYFAAVTEADLEREQEVERLVTENSKIWQTLNLLPDTEIELGAETTRLIRERGWTYWHHLFNPRQLLLQATFIDTWKQLLPSTALEWINIAKITDNNAKLCFWSAPVNQPTHVFYNQTLNTFYNYGTRSWISLKDLLVPLKKIRLPKVASSVSCKPATQLSQFCDLWITDPPYADAVHYHEITEFFIAWLHKNPPVPFNDWIWDSRRALAIHGSGEKFRQGMIHAYQIIGKYMPDNGMQCVMFTHQDTGVWSDLVSIFWASGLQVIAAWYIATETNSELKKGVYVQGTVNLLLKKRPNDIKTGFKQHILPKVHSEVKHQIETMMHLSDGARNQYGIPIFNDADLQMAGYAAALKVLTAYTQIDGEEVVDIASQSRLSNKITLIDEIIQQAEQVANNFLVPKPLTQDTWIKLNGIERFIFRMMTMESDGQSKLDNYQNFAKIFRVQDYQELMSHVTANRAKLKPLSTLTSQDLSSRKALGASRLGSLILAIQQIMQDVNPQIVVDTLKTDLEDFLIIRALLANMCHFIAHKSSEISVREAAEILEIRLNSLRFGE